MGSRAEACTIKEINLILLLKNIENTKGLYVSLRVKLGNLRKLIRAICTKHGTGIGGNFLILTGEKLLNQSA